MNHRPVFLIAAAVLALAACASPSDSASDSSNALAARGDSDSLKQMTELQGSVAKGATVKIKYAPGAYEATKGTLPYIGIAIVAQPIVKTAANARTEGLPLEPAPAPKNVASLHVAGAFPGTPDVLVVDANFNILAQTQGVASANAVEASVDVPLDGAKFVLVRDPGWVQPMDFDVTLAPDATTDAQEAAVSE